MPKPLPHGLLDLLRKPSPCFIATLMRDGSPQLTQTWVSTDGEHVVINIVDGHQKANLARDARVAVNIVDPDNVFRYSAVRGRVIAMTTEGGQESIDEISTSNSASRIRTSPVNQRPASWSPSSPTRSRHPRATESGLGATSPASLSRARYAVARPHWSASRAACHRHRRRSAHARR